jgi:hypothetical protein
MSCRIPEGTLCGIEEGDLPPCEQTLDADRMCPVHCRAHVRTCNVCGHRFTRGEAELETCPDCSKDRHCTNRHRKGKVRCRMHGGSSRAGLSSPRLKHARNSRYLDVLDPAGKRDFQKAKDGPDKLSLEEDIDLLDMRVRRLLAGEPSRAWWKELRETFEEFASAQAAKDRDRSVSALQKMADLIRGGDAEARRWREIDDLAWKRRPRMVLTETRRKVHLSEVVHAAIVVDAMRFISESVRRNVKDPDALSNINTDIRRTIVGALRQLPQPGGDDEG